MDRRRRRRRQPGVRRRLAIGAVTTASLLLATGCNSPVDTAASTDPALAVDPTLASAVPPQYRQDGVLLIANDPSYPPMEFIASGNRVGADIDLANAIAAVVGLKAEFADQAFSTIVPSVGIGRYELGLSSLWAVDRRSPLANMTTYFQAGTQFAVRTSGRAPGSSGMGLCGFSVSVEEGSQVVDMLADQSKACRAANQKPIRIAARESQQIANQLLIKGRVTAMVADSPVVTWLVKNNDGRVRTLGPPSNLRKYGIATPIGSGDWASVVRDAIKVLIDRGEYTRILKRWSIEQGAISDPEVIPASPSIPVANP
ncbi:MAG: transporter substrate-binding domain-containing protein [Candidatus Nanopelagicales bacterium]